MDCCINSAFLVLLAMQNENRINLAQSKACCNLQVVVVYAFVSSIYIFVLFYSAE